MGWVGQGTRRTWHASRALPRQRPTLPRSRPHRPFPAGRRRAFDSGGAAPGPGSTAGYAADPFSSSWARRPPAGRAPRGPGAFATLLRVLVTRSTRGDALAHAALAAMLLGGGAAAAYGGDTAWRAANRGVGLEARRLWGGRGVCLCVVCVRRGGLRVAGAALHARRPQRLLSIRSTKLPSPHPNPSYYDQRLFEDVEAAAAERKRAVGAGSGVGGGGDGRRGRGGGGDGGARPVAAP